MFRKVLNFILITLICFSIAIAGFFWAYIITYVPNSAIQNGGTFIIVVYSVLFFIAGPIFVFGLLAFIFNCRNKNKMASIILMTINYIIILFSEVLFGTGFFNDNIKYYKDSILMIIVPMIFIAIATGITMFNTYTNKMYEPR